MISELDIVVLSREVPEHGLKAGDLGTVVHSYEGAKAFEVEFVSAIGKTVAVLTLPDGDVREVRGEEILHVRELARA